MFEDTIELAENKLLMLYIFTKIKFPISNNQMTQIILENNFINYFTLQQYLSELISSNFIQYIDESDKHRFIITEKGIKVLSLFENRISKNKTETIDSYLKNQLENIKKEVMVTADYTIENNNNFIVNLKAMENASVLIDIKVSVASNKQAKDLCQKWKNSSSELYGKIINTLIQD
jgi:predicted transcriptional regulator